MKHTIILAHPNPASFNAHVATAYAEALAACGEEVIVRDLYAMGFDPCLKASEIPGQKEHGPATDVVAERALLADVQAFAFVYPLWFNAPPAILKGYVDRVFSLGFGYGATFGGTEPALRGRQLITFSSSGAPDAWVAQTEVVASLRRIFDDHLGAVTGLAVLDHVHFGGIVPNITPESVEGMLDEVRDTARRRFGPPA
jgi:NAD(P)H dehydrogenase (quinone)